VVPCSATPGLEIYDRKEHCWKSVERGINPYQNLIVFTGNATDVLSNNYFIGAVHRVVKEQNPRLSLVYEWRGNDNFDLNTKE